MEILTPGYKYQMIQLEEGVQGLNFLAPPQDMSPVDEYVWLSSQLQQVIDVLFDRTNYLHEVLPCVESRDALWYLAVASQAYEEGSYPQKEKSPRIKIIDPGHIYKIRQSEDNCLTITFVKRSGGAIRYRKEWSGVQTQEVLRVLIDATKYLQCIMCGISEEKVHNAEMAAQFLREALFRYEARAWRRKQEKLNRRNGTHNDAEHGRVWRTYPYSDVPFNSESIELRPSGEDGHILVQEE